MSWSGGKDSAYALFKIREEAVYDVRYLFTTFDGSSRTMAIHEVPEWLLEQQAQLVGIPLKKCYLFDSNNAAYETALHRVLEPLQQEGIQHIIFGDLFLEDLRSYREELMKRFGMTCVFPLWQMDSRTLLSDFVAKGFKSMICSVNGNFLTADAVEKMIDDEFIKSLPPTVEPCGENGEYHSFCFDGPVFEHAVAFTKGQTLSKSFQLNQTAGDANNSPAVVIWHMEFLPIHAVRQLTCARCNNDFLCNSSDIQNCQCNGLALSEDIKNQVAIAYKDCLCVNCLRELAAAGPLHKKT